MAETKPKPAEAVNATPSPLRIVSMVETYERELRELRMRLLDSQATLAEQRAVNEELRQQLIEQAKLLPVKRARK